MKGGDAINATFMWDRNEHLQLSVHDNEQDHDNTFYRFFVNLKGHLNRSVLLVSDAVEAYGSKVSPYVNYPFGDAKYNNDCGMQG